MNRAGLAIVLTLFITPVVALADGGVVRARVMQGPFIVTIFTPPDASTAAPADLTVMVQNRDTGEVLVDAAVALSFLPPVGAKVTAPTGLCGNMSHTVVLGDADASGQSTIPATRGQATNRLLYGATVLFPAVGDWRVRATIRHGSEEAAVTCTLPIAAPPRRLAGLWPSLALTPIAILLFALNQWLRRRPARLPAENQQGMTGKTASLSLSNST